MTVLHRGLKTACAARDACLRSTAIFLHDVGHGLLEASHNTLALVGLAVVAGVLFVGGHDDVRHRIETRVLGWLQAREEARADTVGSDAGPVVPPASTAALADAAPQPPATTAALPTAVMVKVALADADAVGRATAADPKDLTHQQSAVVQWLARRYRVAPEPISRLVKEAWNIAPRVGLDPTLVLAIMAIESSFNPFAQSPVGAQGLMQVMTRVHNGKYERFGGTLAAFDPVTNLKVGVQVLKECIARAGSIEAGLRYYVGAANQVDDGGYAGKVLAEQGFLRTVAGGKTVAPNIRPVLPVPAPVRIVHPAPTMLLPAAAPAAEPVEREDAVPAAGPVDDGFRGPQQLALAELPADRVGAVRHR